MICEIFQLEIPMVYIIDILTVFLAFEISKNSNFKNYLGIVNEVGPYWIFLLFNITIPLLLK